jgi:hypothetical protein
MRKHRTYLFEKLKEETTLGTRCRWEDNIKMELKAMWHEDRDWVDVSQLKVQ